MNPRIYWTYNHLVARYQEVRLLQEVGFEVVLRLDELPVSQADNSYNDEASQLYPRWRDKVSLSDDVIERLRRVNIFDTLGKPSEEERLLFNREIDVVYLGGYPDVAAGLLTWFEGVVLYRVMGFVDLPSQELHYEQLDTLKESSGDRLILSPGYAHLVEADRPCARNMLVFNGWVDSERMSTRWAGSQSIPRAATAISYIRFHPFHRAQYESFRGALISYDFVVLGKNDWGTDLVVDPRILGTLPADALYNEIATSRVFVDAGECRTHLIWPPVEAAYMGVPVLFTHQSGLVDPCLFAGYSESALIEAGMFNTLYDIDTFLKNSGSDIQRLQAIADVQASIFNDDVFSRNRAHHALSNFASAITQSNRRYKV